MNAPTASQLPFVLANMAMTADGKIATANREISTFSSNRDAEHLLELRSTADAVMCGARTINSPGVNLGPGPKRFRRLRLKKRLAEYHLRIVVSGMGTINPKAEIFRHQYSPIIVITTERGAASLRRRLRGVSCIVQVHGESTIDFRAASRWLRSAWGVRRLLCEGGGELNDALFGAGLLQELHLTICPKIFGGRTGPTISNGSGASILREATALRLRSRSRNGDELFLIYDVFPRHRSPER